VIRLTNTSKRGMKMYSYDESKSKFVIHDSIDIDDVNTMIKNGWYLTDTVRFINGKPIFRLTKYRESDEEDYIMPDDSVLSQA
jgi:hypothetical protein